MYMCRRGMILLSSENKFAGNAINFLASGTT